jgi:hypothetical protein
MKKGSSIGLLNIAWLLAALLLPLENGIALQTGKISPQDVLIDDDCKWNGLNLYGKVKFVESFPDIKIQIVESFPDLKVKLVESFPDDCGEWQVVESFPDIKVQIVESFPDIKVKFVESFPGIPK